MGTLSEAFQIMIGNGLKEFLAAKSVAKKRTTAMSKNTRREDEYHLCGTIMDRSRMNPDQSRVQSNSSTRRAANDPKFRTSVQR